MARSDFECFFVVLKLANGLSMVSYSLLKAKRLIVFEMLYDGFEAFFERGIGCKKKNEARLYHL